MNGRMANAWVVRWLRSAKSEGKLLRRVAQRGQEWGGEKRGVGMAAGAGDAGAQERRRVGMRGRIETPFGCCAGITDGAGGGSGEEEELFSAIGALPAKAECGSNRKTSPFSGRAGTLPLLESEGPMPARPLQRLVMAGGFADCHRRRTLCTQPGVARSG